MKLARPVNDSTPNISQGFSFSHPGVDYAYLNGTDGYIAGDGIVIKVKNNETRQWLANTPSDPFKPAVGLRKLRTEDYGNYLMVDHGDGYVTLCAHAQPFSILVREGEKVKKGKKAFKIGTTGNSTGNHIHYEVRKNGINIDPASVLDSSFTGYFDPNSQQPQPQPTPVFIFTDQTKVPASLLNSQDYPVQEDQEVQQIRGKYGDLGRALKESASLRNQLADANTGNAIQASLVESLRKQLQAAQEASSIPLAKFSTPELLLELRRRFFGR